MLLEFRNERSVHQGVLGEGPIGKTLLIRGGRKRVYKGKRGIEMTLGLAHVWGQQRYSQAIAGFVEIIQEGNGHFPG